MVTIQDIETIATRHNLTVERKNGHAYLYGAPKNCIATLDDFQRLQLFPSVYTSATVDGVPKEGFRSHVLIHCQVIMRRG